MVKRLFILLMTLTLLIVPNLVIGENSGISFIQYDQLLCKNVTEFSINYNDIVSTNLFNENSIEVFDRIFRSRISSTDIFNITDGWTQEKAYMKVFYSLTKNKLEYRVESDGMWYFIRARMPENLDVEEIQDNFEKFKNSVFEIKKVMRLAIEKARAVFMHG